MGIYHQLGTKPVINARGIYTDLGGSRLSAAVWAAMGEANEHFVRMTELLAGSGAEVAKLLGVESAIVTPGVSAALVLATAVAMTGDDERKMEQLPDATGMPAEVIIQRRHRYKYDRMIRMAGARLVEVGNVNGTTGEELEAAIGHETAAICFPAHLDAIEGTVSLEDVTSLARSRAVPTIVDAAYLNYPPSTMRRFEQAGADLSIFSAKYFGGPNVGAIICGRRDLIELIASIDFTGFEGDKYLKLGRAFKLDRQLIVGVVAALGEWVQADHEARYAGYQAAVDAICERLRGDARLSLDPMCFTMEGFLAPEPVNCVRIGGDGWLDADDLAERLAAGDPSILVNVVNDAVVVDVECVSLAEAELIGDRLNACLGSRSGRMEMTAG
jgi:D-glucosaminate-6-phosphate ammonia-lyase